mmetsp:Transcript_52381/g.111598  ORF Transcript_52381/g.111598 Transcript_52381/m.111598 type:complete len:207 (-) Transcript_52381:902-1522(-)
MEVGLESEESQCSDEDDEVVQDLFVTVIRVKRTFPASLVAKRRSDCECAEQVAKSWPGDDVGCTQGHDVQKNAPTEDRYGDIIDSPSPNMEGFLPMPHIFLNSAADGHEHARKCRGDEDSPDNLERPRSTQLALQVDVEEVVARLRNAGRTGPKSRLPRFAVKVGIVVLELFLLEHRLEAVAANGDGDAEQHDREEGAHGPQGLPR